MMSWWQSLPEHTDPIAFVIGGFPVRFYGLFWLAGFGVAWCFLSVLLRRAGAQESFRESILESLVWVFFGALIGGRLGYALLYAPQYFLHHLAGLFLPFEQGVFTGFFGMSFFGGAIGASAALWFSSPRSLGAFFERADFFALAAPLALFFGRLGNFMNGELFGRVTAVPWGMYFPSGGGMLRHPSQLYEAFLEGILLFFILWHIRRMTVKPGVMSGAFLLLYGIIRFFAEFFREPDFGASLMFGLFTRGQAYSIALFLIAGYFLRSIGRRKSAILEE